ncbi:GNAT family N-acetyltransferase [Polaribacter sargassicola]|uniref:GNAT family N-acetyltransferase n=1 Tax=Polaribacter sargassicola TaxID=2836891 RepID=UPI001F31F4D9|nr:GNAT family N-acetyltransferase [Polaribacter sp. DS7-9]MCG1035619.1 GNAT family N-acetyltransferase [Polaribacter sp. DS7-9]
METLLSFVTINKENYKQVAAIYKEGIATQIATFETEVPDWKTWNNKYLSIGRIGLQEDNKIVAWGSLSATSKRAVYKGVVEVSVYVKETERGKGLGEKVLNKLIKISEEHSIWSLQSSIFRENKASIQIHKKCGFRIIGYKEKIAKLNGVWQDNMLLERRSKIIN